MTLGQQGGGARVVVSTAAFHAGVRGSVPSPGGLKETKFFLPHPRVKLSIVGSLRDREVACSASDRQGYEFRKTIKYKYGKERDEICDHDLKKCKSTMTVLNCHIKNPENPA